MLGGFPLNTLLSSHTTHRLNICSSFKANFQFNYHISVLDTKTQNLCTRGEVLKYHIDNSKNQSQKCLLFIILSKNANFKFCPVKVLILIYRPSRIICDMPCTTVVSPVRNTGFSRFIGLYMAETFFAWEPKQGLFRHKL